MFKSLKMKEDASKGSLDYVLLFNTIWNGMKTHLIRVWCQIDEASGKAWPQSKPPFLARWRFSEEWGGNWTSWLENTLKIAFMLPEWWKGPTASERGFIIWDVACAQNGIRHWTSSPEMSIWEQGSSLLNQLWFIQENWKMKWANFQLFFPFFCMSHLFRSISLALMVRFSGPVPQVNAIICLCVSQAWN